LENQRVTILLTAQQESFFLYWLNQKHDLNVTISENRITIFGEKKQEKKVEKKDYYRIESSYGSVTRSFRLPENVNGDKAKASFKDGMLDLRIPKTEEAKQKKIPVT